MAAFSTFVAGMVIGGAAKWAYDSFWDNDAQPSTELSSMVEASKEKAAEITEPVVAAAEEAAAEETVVEEAVEAPAESAEETQDE